MIVSFAWTTPALLAGRKTCTRRLWSERTFRSLVLAWREGRRQHEAWDKSPRAGGRRVGWITLTCEPYRERLADMPEADVESEGGLWASRDEFIALFGDPTLEPVVIRFEFKPDMRSLPTSPGQNATSAQSASVAGPGGSLRPGRGGEHAAPDQEVTDAPMS